MMENNQVAKYNGQPQQAVASRGMKTCTDARAATPRGRTAEPRPLNAFENVRSEAVRDDDYNAEMGGLPGLVGSSLSMRGA